MSQHSPNIEKHNNNNSSSSSNLADDKPDQAGQVLTASTRRAGINILNDDILDRVFQYLLFDDKIRLRRTCLRWKYLLDAQLNKIKAFRVGRFIRGGYCQTSGLSLSGCDHQSSANHRPFTSSLFNEQFLEFPADLETQCFTVNRYDYLHRALKFNHSSITQLSLGQLNITYRMLMVIAHNLPNLEHLEIISCASKLDSVASTRRANTNNKNSPEINRTKQSGNNNQEARVAGLYEQQQQQQQQQQQERRQRDLRENIWPLESVVPQHARTTHHAPSLEAFNCDRLEQQVDVYKRLVLYNQHSNEQQNMQERLMRSSLVRDCQLVREAKRHTYWPHLRHLLVKECNLLNEFSLCLILAITSKTLTHLVVESNQYLTGEFLNYCGPNLSTLRLNYCPMIRSKFLDDLVKLKQLLSPDQKTFDYVHNEPHLICGKS